MGVIHYNQEECITYGQMNLINDFRTLWTDVAFYLRGYALSVATGMDKLKEATRMRVYHIAHHFESKLEPFFGPEVSEQFEKLIFQLLIDIMQAIDASFAYDEAALNQYVPQIYKDIDNLSTFLAGANPYWSKEQWEDLLTKLLENGLSGLEAIRAEDYEQDFQIIESNVRYATMIGDYMANGLLAYLQPAR